MFEDALAGGATGAVAGTGVFPGIGTAIGAGLGFVGGLASDIWGIYAQDRTWNREDTAVQRRVADLKAANLSPTLAAGSAAQTSGPIGIDFTRPFEGAKEGAQAELAVENAWQMQELAKLQAKADISRTNAQTGLIAAQTMDAQSKADNAPLFYKSRAELQSAKSKIENDTIKDQEKYIKERASTQFYQAKIKEYESNRAFYENGTPNVILDLAEQHAQNVARLAYTNATTNHLSKEDAYLSSQMAKAQAYQNFLSWYMNKPAPPSAADDFTKGRRDLYKDVTDQFDRFGNNLRKNFPWIPGR